MTANNATTLARCRARANEVMGDVLTDVGSEVPSGTLLCHWRVQKLLVERFAAMLAAAEPSPANDAERVAALDLRVNQMSVVPLDEARVRREVAAMLREARAEALEAFAQQLDGEVATLRNLLDRNVGAEMIGDRPRQYVYGKLWQTQHLLGWLRGKIS